jgi:hypothetical protein
LFGRLDLFGWQRGKVGLFFQGGLGSARKGKDNREDAEEI